MKVLAIEPVPRSPETDDTSKSALAALMAGVHGREQNGLLQTVFEAGPKGKGQAQLVLVMDGQRRVLDKDSAVVMATTTPRR